jgi:hypothetical protein
MSEKKSPRPAPRRAAPAAAPAHGPAFTLTTGWAALVIALLVVVFFHELVVGGKTFVSPDTTAPAGFVRMGEQSLWSEHVYPLWNPYVFLGMPSYGSGAYNPLIYPPDWPLALLAKVVPLPDMTWMLLYYALGGLFAFLLARELGARPEGALLGAAAFVFAPNLVAVGSHGHGSQLVDSAYLPLLVWLAARWMKRGGLHHLGWLAIAGGFQFLRGHVQVCFYTWIAVALYGGVAWLATLRTPGELPRATARLVGLGAAAALAFGIAGVYNLPLRDYAQWSIRGGSDAGGGTGMAYATQWSLAPYELPSLVVPGWTGFGGPTYWGGMPFTDYPNAYVGMLTVVLALFAFTRGGAARVFALLLAAFALMVSFGRHFPLYSLMYDHLPLFNKFRIPVMIIVLFQLAAALGMAWGWSAALDRDEDAGRAARVGLLEKVLGGALIVALLAAVLGRGAWTDAYIALATKVKPDYPAEAARFAYGAFMGDLLRASLIGLLGLGLFAAARRGRLPVAGASIAVLMLLAFELWPVSQRVMSPVVGQAVEHSLDAGHDDVVGFLEKAGPPGSFRILPLEEFQSNRFAGFAVASIGGMHAAKPRLVQDFIDANLMTDPAWMRLLGVRFLVTQREFPAASGLTLAYQGTQRVYELPFTLPRATVVDRYRVVATPLAILDSVKAGTHDAATTTWLEQDPKLSLGPAAGATAAITSYRLNDVTVTVDSPAPALLRLADLWYPDWTATVDGKPAAVLKADYLLRAVAVPAGKSTVVFRFQSGALRTGLLVAVGSLLVALALVAAGLLGRRGPLAAPAPGVEA